MQNIHPLGEPHRVYRSIRVAPMISDDFKHASTETLERFGTLVFCADLRKIERIAHFVLDLVRTCAKRRQRVAEPDDGLWRRLRHSIMIC